MNWAALWNEKASSMTDFQATGRGTMDVVGFLYTVREIARVLELSPGESLLDIGCGTGIVALALAPWARRIVGVDFSPAMVARAQANASDAENLSFQVGDITQLGLGAARFDKVLAYSVLQYLPDESAVLKAFGEVASALAPGGKALLAANPDPARKGAYREVLERAASSAEERERNLGYLDTTLWLAPARAVELAASLGLRAEARPIHPRIWQHFYMYDLVVTHG